MRNANSKETPQPRQGEERRRRRHLQGLVVDGVAEVEVERPVRPYQHITRRLLHNRRRRHLAPIARFSWTPNYLPLLLPSLPLLVSETSTHLNPAPTDPRRRSRTNPPPNGRNLHERHEGDMQRHRPERKYWVMSRRSPSPGVKA